MSTSQQTGQQRGSWIPDSKQKSTHVIANRAHYLFSPCEPITLDGRYYSLKELRPRRLEMISTKTYSDRSVDEAVMKGESDPFLEEQDNPAAGQANALYESYEDAGLIISRSLLGAHEDVRGWVEALLIGTAAPADEEDEDSDGIRTWPSLASFQRQLISDVPKRIAEAQVPPEIRRYVESLFYGQVQTYRQFLHAVRSELARACATAERYLRTYYGSYTGEMKKAGKGKNGIDYVHDKLRWVCKELEITPPDDLETEIQRLRAQQTGGVPQPGDGIERTQCPRCYSPVPMMNGLLPIFCTHCGGNPRELVADATPAEEISLVTTTTVELLAGGEVAPLAEPVQTPALEALPEPPPATLAEKSEAVFSDPPPSGVPASGPKGGKVGKKVRS